MAAAYDNGRQRQQPTTMAVMAYDKKGTMAYIDGRQRQQPTMVVAAAYIDNRQRPWPTPMSAVLIMTMRGEGSSQGMGGEYAQTGEG